MDAAFEYFITILVSGAYLAKITSAIGISDSLTGILSAFVSLGCGFQIIAVFLANKQPVKRWLTPLYCLTHTCFGILCFIPLLSISRTGKTVLFGAFLLIGNIISRVLSSPKANWSMSLVDDDKRGSYTASKEMVSLIGGMLFAFLMGAVIDRYEEMENLRGALIVCGVSIFVLTALHGLMLMLSLEKTDIERRKTSASEMIRELITDKNLFKVIVISVLWNIANYSSTPFYGSYQIKELGFTMTFVSILSASYAILRTLVSKPIGKFADKRSFASMLNICFSVMLIGFTVNIFTVPENGKILYTVYYMLSAIAMAGINSSTVNLIYDYVDKEKRIGALALQGTLSGLAGFFTTLLLTPLVDRIQNNGNRLFGIHVYAQQILSAIAAVIVAILILYLNLVVKRIKREK